MKKTPLKPTPQFAKLVVAAWWQSKNKERVLVTNIEDWSIVNKDNTYTLQGIPTIKNLKGKDLSSSKVTIPFTISSTNDIVIL